MTSSSDSRPAWLTQEEYELSKAAALELEFQACGRDPARFILQYLHTEDSQDPEHPYKPFPERCYEYLKALLHLIETEPLLAIEKSRQVMVTWLLAAYSLWLCIFRKGAVVRIQSITREDAEAVIDRIAVMYRSLPDWIKDRAPAIILGRQIKFPKTRSKIGSIPQGAGHHRGPTPTLIWSDETAAQTDLAAIWKALKPSLNAGKGRYIATSTQAPGWFRVLTKDLLEAGEAPPPIDHHEVCHGLTVRHLARNRFCVARLHYSADPEKRDPEWIARAKAGYASADWQQEYEIDPDAKAGVAALPAFTLYQDRILSSPFAIPDHWPRYGAMDYGIRSPTSIHLYAVDEQGVSWAYWEYYSPGPLGPHLQALKNHHDFPRLEMILLDRSCWAMTQQTSTTIEGQTTHSVRSIAELCEDAGVFCTPAAKVDDRTKITVWDRVWSGLEDRQKKPAFRIFRTCVNLVRELPGIVWAEYSDLQQRTHNVKESLVDKDNHAFDDASYWLLFRYSDAVPDLSGPDPTPAQIAEATARKWREEDCAKTMAEIEQRQAEQQYGDGGDVDWD